MFNIFSKRSPIARIAFNMKPRSGPYGGGNQWLTQMIPFMERAGYAVQFHLDDKVDCMVGTHAGLGGGGLCITYEEVLEAKKRMPGLRCLQRINDNDIRKGTDEMDAELAAANRAADFTVFVSQWLRDYHSSNWFDPAKPHAVIGNGADPAVFHPIGSNIWKQGDALRLITHHWSDNPAKGFDVYAAIDNEIVEGRLPDTELWIIGRWPQNIRWRAAKTFPPTASHALASLLRQCHVYVTASRYEPGPMHPVEGLQCGMPLLVYRDCGGSIELGNQYGMAFDGDDIPGSVARMRGRYAELREKVLTNPPSGDLMCLQYRRLVQRLITSGKHMRIYRTGH